MTARHMIVSPHGGSPAVQNLPQPLARESPLPLEQGLPDKQTKLRNEVSTVPALPGELEYESWMQQLRSSRP